MKLFAITKLWLDNLLEQGSDVECDCDVELFTNEQDAVKAMNKIALNCLEARGLPHSFTYDDNDHIHGFFKGMSVDDFGYELETTINSEYIKYLICIDFFDPDENVYSQFSIKLETKEVV